MNIIHFCITPMAGAPVRLVRALNKYTSFNVNLVDLNRWGIYEHDLIFSEDQEKVMELSEKADIIHFHNYIDYNTKDFFPLDFKSLRDKGKFFIRQFHSSPDLISRKLNISSESLHISSIPSLVIAQFQERYYPESLVVPNIIPQDSDLYQRTGKHPLYGLFLNPTVIASAWSDRWNTKGLPETLLELRKAVKATGSNIKCVSNISHNNTLKLMDRSEIVINDLVTGSYHLSGLEGLSLSKPVINFLDDRVQYVLRQISGASSIPFINARLEDTRDIAIYLLRNKNDAVEIGSEGRKWIDKYWQDKKLVSHYINVYNTLVNDPCKIKRQRSLSLENKHIHFHSIILPDKIYESRKFRYGFFKKNIIKLLSILLKKYIRYFPFSLIRNIFFNNNNPDKNP